MCLFYSKLHLQFRSVCWTHQTFLSSQAERASVGKSTASGEALLLGVLHLLTATAIPVCNLGWWRAQLPSHKCITKLVT